MPNYTRKGSGVSFSPATPLRQTPRYATVDVRDTTSSPVLIGDDEAGLIVTVTPDTTPELQFRWPGAPPATVQLTNDGGTTLFGPYAVVGIQALVTVPLAPGIYTPVGTAQNSKGVLVPIGGQLEIYLGKAYSSFGGIAYTDHTGVSYMVGA